MEIFLHTSISMLLLPCLATTLWTFSMVWLLESTRRDLPWECLLIMVWMYTRWNEFLGCDCVNTSLIVLNMCSTIHVFDWWCRAIRKSRLERRDIIFSLSTFIGCSICLPLSLIHSFSILLSLLPYSIRYITGYLRLGYINGPNEGIECVVLFYLFQAFYGMNQRDLITLF